ncbi:DoxX family protein [Nitratireductor indicus C115]|uniref:DoxX family protein n=1 Tax=Nitratireductor indicus C115 TaxID=1231190 RepID=K2N7K5_9HYPH|nr:DoxX family protein [Nitratireductor indicus]EKF43458.1 DoxX family protein [Nitratireductor indicus C115]SFQ07226.1 putative oxidoreductase [Nitratireductor indicus]
MPEAFVAFLPVLGRLCLGGAFVFAGLRNLGNIPALSDALAQRGVPAAKLVLMAGIGLQCVAGALFAAGFLTAYAAAALVVFLVAATAIFHNFWDHRGMDRSARINGVVANIALAGSFLLAMAHS